jgi:dTDP-4-dehydrorhamnose reductase
MNITIFGAGFLGKRLARDLKGARLVPVDITDRDAVLAALREHPTDAVVNAAGKTGVPNVDWCETHQAETFRANVQGALTLADACSQLGVYLLHLGSGCIFYGDSPQPDGWREDDFANPSAFYSRTKYAADLVLSRMPNVSVVRLRMPIDGVPGPRNLITKLAGYRQVIDVENSVTVVADLVEVVRGLIERRASGVFHAVNPGKMRHRDLLSGYREIVDPSHQATLIDEKELVTRGLAAKARSNCILANTRLPELGIHLRPIDVALRDALETYARARLTR